MPLAGHSLLTRLKQAGNTSQQSHAGQSISSSFKILSVSPHRRLASPRAVAEVEAETAIESNESISTLPLQSDADIALNAALTARKERIALKKKLKKRQMWPPSKAAVNPQSRKYKTRSAQKKKAAEIAASKEGSEE